MEKHARFREQLVARASELLERIRFIEEEARQRGFACVGEDASDIPINQGLARFLDPSRTEARRAQSAVSRIDRREFGCCILCGGDIGEVLLERFPYAVDCEACSSNFPGSYEEELRMQHKGLRRLAAHLEEEAARIRRFIASREEVRPAAVALEVMILNLLRELPRHFAMEERGGYLSAALELAPQHQHRAEVLHKEHEELIRSLQQLRTLIEAVDSIDDGWGRLDRGIRLYVNDLYAHEEAENEILESAFRTEIGGTG